jgi:hypothetical protein
MKTVIEYKPKTIAEHYADIRQMFENWGATVLGVTHELHEDCDPGCAFVVALKGRQTPLYSHLAGQVMTNYAYRIEWTL